MRLFSSPFLPSLALAGGLIFVADHAAQAQSIPSFGGPQMSFGRRDFGPRDTDRGPSRIFTPSQKGMTRDSNGAPPTREGKGLSGRPLLKSGPDVQSDSARPWKKPGREMQTDVVKRGGPKQDRETNSDALKRGRPKLDSETYGDVIKRGGQKSQRETNSDNPKGPWPKGPLQKPDRTTNGDNPRGPWTKPGKATNSDNPKGPWPKPEQATSNDNPKGPGSRPGNNTNPRPGCGGQGSGPILRSTGAGCQPPVIVVDPVPPVRPPVYDPPVRPPVIVVDPIPPGCGGQTPGTILRRAAPGCPPIIVVDPVPPVYDPPVRPPVYDPPARPPVIVVDPLPPFVPQPPTIIVDPLPPSGPPPRNVVTQEEGPAPRQRPQARRTPAATPPNFTRTLAPFPPRRDYLAAEQQLFRPAEVLVMVQGPEPDATAARLAQSFNLVVEESQAFALLEGSQMYRFSIPDNRAVEGVVAAMANSPGVSMTLPNFYHFLQGSTGKEALTLQYALPKLRVPDTQDLASGRGITVAVIDSGVDAEHPVFKRANITVFDAIDGGIKDPDQHGTAIAGIIAGRGDVNGIAPGAKILAVRAFAPERLGAAPSTTSMTLARATDIAFARGARIFNMSFAGPKDPLLLALIDAAHGKGAVFVAAAGNQGPTAPPAYPAAHSKVIAITATDEVDALYAQANRGGYVAIAAPGVDILAPVTGKGLDYLSGTSFAAAHISGIIALLMERNPKLAPDDIHEILVEAAHDLGTVGRDEDFGAGLADAYGALILAGPEMQSSINQ